MPFKFVTGTFSTTSLKRIDTDSEQLVSTEPSAGEPLGGFIAFADRRNAIEMEC